jgi:DNA replication protein DnaC
LLDDRYDKRSTLFTSQFPTDVWHENLDDPTLADAILDRVLLGRVSARVERGEFTQVQAELDEW